MVFSLMLWMPSWGGMINGLLTLRGAWHKVSEDPVLKFFVVGITFYGMATFEGPMLSIKSVNALSHYTDWTIAHVHSGALGWNGFMTFGMMYWLAPRLFQTKLYSKKLAEVHFWVGTIGILLYVVAIYAAGVTQGLMWRAFDSTGRLAYPDFIETVVRILPMYWVRVARRHAVHVGHAHGAHQHHHDLAAPARARTKSRAIEARRRFEPYHGPTTELAIPAHSTISDNGHRLISSRKPSGTASGSACRSSSRCWVGDRGDRRVAVRDRADVPDPIERADDRVGEAVHAARARRSRHLHPRGLLQLPLADDPSDSLGDRALRRVLEAGRVRLRPSVPVGLAPHRAGSAPHRRQVPVPLARAPHAGPALDDSAIDHAGVHLALQDDLDYASIQKRVDAMAMLGVPYGDAVLHAESMARAQARQISSEIVAQGGPDRLEAKKIIALIAYLQRLGTDIKKLPPSAPPPEPRAENAASATEITSNVLPAKAATEGF